MKRKIILSISVLLILIEIGIGAALLDTGARQFSASLDRFIEFVREISRPIPTFRALL